MNWFNESQDQDDNGKSKWPDMSQMEANIPPNIGKIAKLLIIPAVIIVLFIIFNVVKDIGTEWLWFSSLEFSSVYSTKLSVKVATFFVAALIFLVLFAGNLLIARQLGPKSAIPFIPAEPLKKMRRLTIAGIGAGSILLSIIFGSTAQSHWETILKYQNGQSFNIPDPIFNQDVGFYMFTLPFHQFVQGWLLGALIVTLIATIAFYVFSYRVRRLNFDITLGVKAHLSVLVATILGFYVWRYFIDMFNLVYSERGAVFGAGYTDVNAQLIAYKILIAVAIVCAIVVLVNIFLRGFRLPVYAFGILVVSIIVVSVIYPAAVQRFQVNPSELTKESEYIGYNIEFTRQAFALDRIEEIPFTADEVLIQEDIEANPTTINNIRIWDHRPLKSTYVQKQALRPYYDFYDVDIDRYNIDDQYQQVMLAGRELYQENLDPKAQTWVNERLVYTHGYGIVLSPVAEVTDEGAPVLKVKDIPPDSGNITRLQIERPQIYHGEKTDSYVIVGTNEMEFDYPVGTENAVTTYDGKGGIPLNSFLRRLAFGWKLNDFNVVISGEITSDSKLLLHRNIQDRVSRIAPFLQLDDDPYLVITEDGKLVWILDAYTWSDRYPYSEPLENDPEDTNYIRNSVKAVIDAYDGTVTLYVVEPDDPVIQTYQAIFPELFTPGDEMPEDIKAHMRYPQDLFDKQAQTYLRYHMQDVRVFYGKEDLWTFPEEVSKGATQRMEPYYIIMRLPEEEREEFLLMQPFTPENKKNAIAWLAARSDGDNYGKLLAYSLPKEKLIFGPKQIEDLISQDTTITEKFTLWKGGGAANVWRGNLLMIPIEDSFLYVEPVFLQATGGGAGIPVLQRVIVANRDTIAMEETLEEALAAVFGGVAPEPTPTPGLTPTPSPTTPVGPTPTPDGEPPSNLNELLISIQQHQDKEQEYAGAGNWVAAAEERAAWEAEFQQLVELIQQLTEEE